MQFYLRTLEGAPRFGSVTSDRAQYLRDTFCIFYKNNFAGEPDEVQRILKSIKALEYHATPEEIEVVINTLPIALFALNKTGKQPEADEAVNLYKWQKEAEAERDALDERKRADKARREAGAEAEAERDALDERKRADKARQEAEAAQADAADAAAAQAAEEAEQIINEVETMPNQNIEIGAQVISSGHEYTVIDETPSTIVYEDEGGKMYVEEKPKTNIFMWLGLGLLLWKILK